MTEGAVLLIGGTGFIGSHLAERLASGGRPVRVASRRGAWPWGKTPPGIELVALDLTRADAPDALDRALEGTVAAVNLAGILGRVGVRGAAYEDLHVAGVARLAAAAAKRSAALAPQPYRTVHVSTTGVLGPTGPTPRDETASPAPVTPYETSKLEGERAALASRAPGLEVVVVRPGLVYGPRDLHLLPLYRAIAHRAYLAIGGGAALWQPIYVTDVARAIQTVLEMPRCDGEIFHIAGAEQVTVLSLARHIARRLGGNIWPFGTPYALAMIGGAILELVCRPLGIDPPLSRARVRTLTEDRVYAIDRARERLGFAPEVTIQEGIGHAVNWYRRHGYL